MDLLLMLSVVVAFPVACLGFVLWMGRVEDSLPGAVRRAVRTPDPPPVLAIPVRRPASPVAVIPLQRREPPAELPAVPPVVQQPVEQQSVPRSA